MDTVHELNTHLEHAQRSQHHEHEQVAHANARVSNALTHFNKQQARVETEYHRVLK